MEDKQGGLESAGILNDLKIQNGLKIRDGFFVSYEGRAETVIVPEGVHTIGEDAFKACVSIKKIVLPQSLRRILPRAFKGCRNLCELEIPEGVKEIGEYAFHRCHSLRSIHLPASVIELGSCVFLYCDHLVEAWIPGVRRLGHQAFLNDTTLCRLVISRDLDPDCICDVFTSCGRLCDIAFSDGERYLLSGLVGAAIGEGSLPFLIRRIAEDVLSMFELDGHCLVRFRTNLKYVEIPEGIDQIGKSCFFDRRGILSVRLPASLKEIRSRAFRNCINLEEVIFQNGKVKIDSDAFKNCTSLKRIITPEGEFLMRGIEGGVEREERSNNLVHTIHRQILGNFRFCGTVLLKYLGNESRVVVPDGVTRIANEAFAGKEEIDRILLPESLTEIGERAFRGCLLLQTIKIPGSVKKIGEGAFENCVKLLRILLPELEQIEENTFRHCKKLKEVHFGQKLKRIGRQVFYGCNSLTQINLPEQLEEIGVMGFYRCNKLEKIYIPETLKKIGNLAFAQSGLLEVQILSDGKEFGSDLFCDCTRLHTLLLGDGVRHIPDKLAFGCAALTTVSLPETIESVGRNAFEKTPFLKAWKEEFARIRNYGEKKENSLSSIFWDGSDLEGEFTLPANFRIIAGGAYYGNIKVTKICLHEDITWVGRAAFKGCTALASIVWTKNLCNAQPEIFSGCGALEIIENAPSWKIVGERAFCGCKKLSRLDLSKVEWIGKEAFTGCILLEKGEVGATRYIGESAFADTPYTYREIDSFSREPLAYPPPIEVASIIVEKWQQCTYGAVAIGIVGVAPYTFYQETLLSRLYLNGTVQWIGEGAFAGCSQIEKITFPSKNCRIDTRAFEKCSSLKSVLLHTETVGESAFAQCIALKRAMLIGTTKLSKRAFEGCEALRQISIKTGERIEIEEFCFCGCRELTKLNLSRAEQIGRYAFANCDNLKQITLPCDAVIAPYAFADCGQLRTIYISGDKPRLLIGEDAFSGCTALSEVIWKGQDIRECWKFETYQDIFDPQIPQEIRMIFYSARSCFEVEDGENLTAYHGSGRIVIIPNGIRRINPEVFRDCVTLSFLSIPKTVEYIGARAFHGTEWLARQQRNRGMVVVNHLLLDASNCVGEVVIPEEIHMICGWAFANGMGIKEIRFLSDSVKMEEFAFRNCIYLEKIHLPNQPEIQLSGIADREKDLPPLAKQIVQECLNCFKTDSENRLIECTGNIEKLLVADGITAIGEGTFKESNLLTEIFLPPSVIAIEKNAFCSCKWLQTVRQSNRKEGGAGGIQRIGEMAFWGCRCLEFVELSDELTEIGKRAFEHCISLSEIYLPEGMEEIPERAFFRCHNLEKVIFPSTLKRIGKEAFAFCRKLTPPKFPENVMVGERAFAK